MSQVFDGDGRKEGRREGSQAGRKERRHNGRKERGGKAGKKKIYHKYSSYFEPYLLLAVSSLARKVIVSPSKI